MAAGLAANLTANPFASVTTVTAQIVQLLTGDQEFDSAKTLAAFALGLCLFLITLAAQPHRAPRSCANIGNNMSSARTPQPLDRRRRCTKRVRRRYAAERRFRLLGLARGRRCRSLFLAFLLVTMAAKGLGGFIRL